MKKATLTRSQILEIIDAKGLIIELDTVHYLEASNLEWSLTASYDVRDRGWRYEIEKSIVHV